VYTVYKDDVIHVSEVENGWGKITIRKDSETVIEGWLNLKYTDKY